MPINNPAPAGGGVFGTFAGDGNANRRILTGFACRLVIVYNSNDNVFWIAGGPTTNMELKPVNTIGASTALILHAADGFEVDGAGSMNFIGYDYNYVAFGP